MTIALMGVRTLSMSTDREGNRSYKVRYLVRTTSKDDGPAAIASSTVLPAFGSAYTDLKSDTDVWAFCTFETEVERHETPAGETGYHWAVDKVFTTVAPRGRNLSQMPSASGASAHPPGKGDPTDQQANPPQISVGFTRYTEEALLDFNDRPIMTSSHEYIRGPQNEWDMSRIQIKIKQSVSEAAIQLEALVNMVDTVNKYALWGFPPRTLKLTEAPVEWRWYGNGTAYFDRSLTFDVRYRGRVGITSILSPTGTGTGLVEDLEEDQYLETWDRYVPDEGTKVLKGHWNLATGSYVLDTIGGSAPDKTNPHHFIRFQDRQGNVGRVLLDGNGVPANVVVTPSGSGSTSTTTEISAAGRRFIQFYGESDFSLIPHLPTSLVPLVVP